MEGLGDLVEVVAKGTGITRVVEIVKKGKCGGCAARKKRLNELFPINLNKK
jgi:hypothetical protein